MKTILTTATLVFALSFNCSAQQQQVMFRQGQQMTPEERTQLQVTMAQRQTQQMKERLKLDAEQEKAIGEINLKYAVLRVQVTDLAQSQEGADIPALMTELEAKQENDILPFLNENQIEPYYELKKEQQERRQQMMQRRGDGGGQPPQQRGEGQQRRQRE
ncbi:MAG: hypothetical protein LBP96_02215 [Bacteroidales bacterium]|jgi:hypothetical protein|nr:hypothetical protein [Bacteroidales bacterium]